MDNPQAFPSTEYNYIGDGNFEKINIQGMTLLDYFAGQALVGLLAHSCEYDYEREIGNKKSGLLLAEACYEISNNMLKQRELTMKGN